MLTRLLGLLCVGGGRGGLGGLLEGQIGGPLPLLALALGLFQLLLLLLLMLSKRLLVLL
jgi:hypothetical protein